MPLVARRIVEEEEDFSFFDEGGEYLTTTTGEEEEEEKASTTVAIAAGGGKGEDDVSASRAIVIAAADGIVDVMGLGMVVNMMFVLTRWLRSACVKVHFLCACIYAMKTDDACADDCKKKLCSTKIRCFTFFSSN